MVFICFSRPIRCPLCLRVTPRSSVILLNTSCLLRENTPILSKECRVVLHKYNEKSIWSLVPGTRANLFRDMIRRHSSQNRCDAGASTSRETSPPNEINQLSSNLNANSESSESGVDDTVPNDSSYVHDNLDSTESQIANTIQNRSIEQPSDETSSLPNHSEENPDKMTSSASNGGQEQSRNFGRDITLRRSRAQLTFQITHCVQCSKSMVTDDLSKAFCSEKCLQRFNKRY